VERYQGRPFALVGVNLDGDANVVLGLQQKGAVTWRSICVGADRVAATYGVHGIPLVVVIDHKGVVQSVSVGPPDATEFDRNLDKLVAAVEVGK
jgi:hypothetical protein